MNKPKILYVLPTLKKDGAEVQIANLIKNCDNFEIDLFTFDLYRIGDSIEQNLGEIKVFSKKRILSIIEIYKLIQVNNYDIVHSHLPKADLFVGLINLFNNSFIHIISVHAQYGTRTEESKIKYLFFNIFWKFILNRSDGVIAISGKIKKWLVQNKKISSKKITTIHYGIEITNRTESTLNGNTIGMAARILPWKGWEGVLKVALVLKKQNLDYKLIFAGSDDINYKKTLVEKVKEQGLEEYVFFHNHYENIEDFFSKIDLFLFLSESEGFGLVVLEAIENNTPVICSNIEPLSEFVDNSFNTLVNPNNFNDIATLAAKILDDKNFKNKVQTKQKEKIIKEFSIGKASYKYENYYIKLLNN
jgi:glycosyltransferase involved in cell wall biosynthesis|tara:strand:+ start:15911 stop:16993 length:1083 start_codon:yes stop_codon:yes gene_type:complete